MKTSPICTLALLAVVSGVSVKALQIDIAAVPTAALQFNGSANTFDFAPASAGPAVGWDFTVTSTVGLPGDSIGLLGHIDGPFTIGAITVNGPLQTAPVAGTGTLQIGSPSGDFNGSIVWDTISTLGAGGVINVDGVLNLTGTSYVGTVADLVALAAVGDGVATVTFQFPSPLPLTALTANGTSASTSWSGSLSAPQRPPKVPDSGTTVQLLGLAFLMVSCAPKIVRQ